MNYRYIQVHTLTPHIGAEVSGVDLCGPLSDEVFEEIHQAWMKHLVLFFRDQPMSSAQHLGLWSAFWRIAYPSCRALCAR